MKGKLYQRILAGILVSVVTFTSCDWTGYEVRAQEAKTSSAETAAVSSEASESSDGEKDSTENETAEAVSAEVLEMDEEELREFLDGMERVELEEERTLNSTTFLYENGYKETELYAADVRYLDEDGSMVDYDASLIDVASDNTSDGEALEGYLYENAAGDKKVYLPESLENNPLILENGEYTIKITPKFEREEVRAVQEHIDMASADKKGNGFSISEESECVLEEPEARSEPVEDLYGETEEKVTSVIYPSADESYELEYISQNSGVKENLILSEIPLSNVWEFELTLTEGMYAQKDELTETVSIYDGKSDTIVAGIEAPYMNDATGENYSESITYGIELTNPETNTYTLCMTVDSEYLKSAVYPVTIDPTYSWTCTTGLHDVYVYAGTYADTNFYASGVTAMYMGRCSAGAIRTYMSFDGLTSKVSGMSVISATLSMTETSGSTEGMTVQAFRVTGSYTKSSLTWNNRPAYNSTVLGSLTTSGTGGTVKTISVTSFVRSVANGTSNYGVLLKATSESISGNRAVFYGSRASANTPKLTITYTDKPTQAETVSLASAYIKKGGSLTVSWTGIESIALYQIQYKIVEYDISNKTAGDTVIAYTRLANGAESGSATVSASSLPEGEYCIYVRGVDAYTGKGTGTGKTFVIDSTAPVFSSFSYTSSSSSSYSSTVPTLTWSVTESYFSAIKYSVDSGTWYSLSTSKSASAAIPASRFSGAGSYSISVKAYDKSGNVSVTKSFTYYYDPVAPTLTMSLSPSGTGNTDRPTISWTASDTTLKAIYYKVGSGSYTQISTSASGSYQIPSGKLTEGETSTIYLKAVDKAGNATVKSAAYIYDTTKPSVTMTLSPSMGKTDTTTIKWTVTDASVKTVSYKIGSASYKQIGTSDSGSYEVSSGQMAEGNNTVYLKVSDQAGNETVVSRTYCYDPVSPELDGVRYDPELNAIRMYINNDSVKSSFVGVMMYAIVSAGEDAIAGTSDLKKYLGGFSTTGNTMEKDGAVWTEYKVSLSGLSSTEDGIYDLCFTLPDRAGNYSQIQRVRLYRFNSAEYDASLYLNVWQEDETAGTMQTVCLGMDCEEALERISVYRMTDENGFVCVADGVLASDVTVTDEDGESSICITDELDISFLLEDEEAAASYRIMAVYESGEAKLSDIASIQFSESGENETDEESLSGFGLFFTSADSDGDGLEDGYELWDFYSDPHETDSDGDGFTDDYEVYVLGTHPAVYTEDTDRDGDGWSDLEEQETGTNPYLADTDFDGISDSGDEAPLKTDTDGMNPQYSVEVPIGLYDVERSEEDENGNTYTYTYNIYSGAVSRYVYADGTVTLTWYDRQFRQIAVQTYADGVWYANTYTYDEDGNITWLTHNGFGYSFYYNDDSELTSVRIGDSVLKRNIYEEVTVPEHTDSEGETVEAYETSILHGTVYGNGAEYRYVYDSLYENIRKVYLNDQLLYEMDYDGDGNLTAEYDYVNGVTYTYQYNEDGEVVGVSADSGFSISCDYEETGEDEPQLGITTCSYNGVSRVYTTTMESDEETGSSSTRTEYSDGMVSEAVLDGDTEISSYAVSVDGRVVYQKTTESAERTDTVRYLSGSEEVYAYDEHGNIISITKDGKLCYSYEYDALGELIRENDAVSGKTRLYSYDAGGNLLSVETYAYSTGEISGAALSTETYAYGNGTWKDLLTSYNGEAITYDEIGNPLSYRNGMSFCWEYGRSLSTVAAYADDGSAVAVSYAYNQSGVRTQKTVNGTVTSYALDGYTIRYEETDGAVTEYLYDGSGTLTGFVREGTTYLYRTNLQGDVTAILDAGGNTLAAYTYDAWGNLTGITGDTALAESNPFRYRGYYFDSETGFYYLNSRYYDPQTGRFLNADETDYLGISGTALGYNLYAYCENSPSNKSDPIGYKAINITLKLTATMYANALYLYTIAKLYRWAGIIGKLALLYKFYNLVKTGGKWDLKNQSKWKLKLGDYYTFMGVKLRIDDIGNIHFGFVGSVLFSWITLCTGAGIYQIYSGTYGCWYTFFDDPRDTLCISLGRAMWRIVFGRWVFQW